MEKAHTGKPELGEVLLSQRRDKVDDFLSGSPALGLEVAPGFGVICLAAVYLLQLICVRGQTSQRDEMGVEGNKIVP